MSGAQVRAGSRLGGIEFGRFLAAVAVVLIHFWPRREGGPPLGCEHIVIGTCRFAVPFFFATSAYFLKDRLPDFRAGARFAWKWTKILLIWHAVHAVWFTLVHFTKNPDPFHTTPMWLERLFTVDTLFEGVAWPLWYLHSLVLCVLLASAIPSKARVAALLSLGAVLYALALTWDPWRGLMPAHWGFPPFGIKAREFLFSGLLPFAIGFATVRAPSRIPSIAVLALGFALQTTEVVLSPVTPWGNQHDFFLGSVVAGAGLFWAGLSWNPFPRLARLGGASLPMYILQLIVFAILRAAVSFTLAKSGAVQSGSLELFATLIALPIFVVACMFIGESAAWKRLHQ